MAFFKLLLFLFLVTLQIASFTVNGEASSSPENNGCNGLQNHLLNELKSTVSALQSIITEKNQELLSKEEKIRGLELYIREKSYLFESEIDFSQIENPVKHASEVEEKVYELQKQVFGLKREVEIQRTRRLEMEAEIAEIKVAELSSNHDNDGKWFLSKLGLNTDKTQVSQKIEQVQKWSEPHIETLNSVIRIHTHPYTTRIMTLTKPHLERVQVALEPYTENVRHGFKKLVNSTKIYHQQAQEMLKNNEITKPIATMDLAWVGATALIGFPLIFIIKLLSAVSNPKRKKRYSHKKEPTIGYRRAKRRHPHQ
ncbi:EMB1353 [Arabidopsis lyrata subsp. lyrata]|uniref:EMB1353 n=1 Tax=Arabidopsis lyrata subsp. lyrata TaxID=81972 RepID=D7MC87_ARALL|nr:EMB1353 [Arabidopsis lyrata subsp. lyrata]